MTKISGLGQNFYIAGYNLSGDVGSITRCACPMTPLDVTAIDKSAYERIGGQRDGVLDWECWFNDAALQEHAALKNPAITDRIVTWTTGTSIGSSVASMVAKQTNYDMTREQNGSLHFSVSAIANGYAMEWGKMGTAGVRTDTGATAGSALDSGAATTNFGLQAYLHVFSFTGTDATIKLQESSDNGADAYADVTGGGFTQVTAAPTSQRIATATNLAVERYLKVTTVTTGGFSSLAFAVAIVRNGSAPVF